MTNIFISVKGIEHSEYKWIDTRFSLQDRELGKRKYLENHVSGAVYWDLERDLSDMTKRDGRHPMPEKESLIKLFEISGLAITDNIIIYDDGGSPFATRAWWLLQYAGFENALIALEGFDEINESGIPVNGEIPQQMRTSVTPNWNEDLYASRKYVEDTVSGETTSVLLDARSAVRYRGEKEPIDPIAGRIPGALNFDWERLKKDGRFNLDASVKDELNLAVNPLEEVTVYCGSGVTAAPLYAMLAQNGYKNVRLYVGSYSDWISHEGAKVEKD